MKKRKKSMRQIIVAFLLLYTIGLPIQNIVLANELSPTEEVITEETESATTAEMDTSNSEDIESESVPPSEKEVESTEKSSSETVLKESEVLTDTSDFNFAEKQEFSEEPRSATQQNEGRPSTKAVTTGTFPNGSTATWTFDDATGTLSISGGTLINPNRSIDGLIGIPVTKITNIVLEDKVFASGNCQTLFRNSAATSLDLSNLDTSNVTSMRQMFYSNAATSLDLSNFDTSKVTDMYYMFAASAATSLDLSNWDTSNVKNMYSMFYGNLATSLDLSSFDTSNVTDMGNMFIGSLATSLDLSNFDTSKVTNMYGMFQYSAATSLNLSNFDTSNVTNMGNMFDRSAVTSLDLSNFDTSKVTGMSSMFNQSVATSLDLSSFDTSKVAYMTNMFAGASQLQMLTLGSQFKFVGTAAALPNPTPTAKYTGKWQNVGSGTIDKPTGIFGGTATELMSTYDGSTMAGLYVWQQPFLNVKDSMLMIGDNWNPEYNFSDAIDSAGDPVDFNAITVTGSVDTTQPGVYTVTYSYGGITSTATVTVLETIPASWINFFVDGTNVRSIPGSALSTPEWDLTTGLWDRWNPGTIKVPADKLPSEPTKQGYEFKGWEDTAGTIVDFNTLDLDLNSQNEFNFYAAFEKKEYTVTFDVEGKQKQQAVLFEELITEPTVPNKAGYAFTGWYDAKTGGTKWDFSTDTMPAGNVTLYARFNKLGFVTPGVNPITPNVEPPTKPGERPNLVTPSTPGAGGNQTPSNGSGLNTGKTAITSPTTSQGGKLAKLGENNSLLLQVVGLLLVLSGVAFFLVKRRKTHS
ncbi:BspA family leucine-rich repeat surface protein [Listeria monocytogenes]|uniref:BspA family leucine-rich repeat surface protein n=1 Tax=Listeria monocytogenes TaxID=1639 RepID=UPI0011EB1584|nr:BspA family leucine-rich repeat surface protein [Listeria monocytogenes]TYV64948.1 BspA family leucine-rich repeat surface protein [Listeria monocytogenes]